MLTYAWRLTLEDSDKLCKEINFTVHGIQSQWNNMADHMFDSFQIPLILILISFSTFYLMPQVCRQSK